MKIYEAIQAHRSNAGISQNELHRRTGIPQTTLCYWESGKGCPTVDDCLLIAEGLGIAFFDLLRGVDEATKQ